MDNWLLNLSEDEVDLIERINEVFKYTFPECDLLGYTLLNIKIQGAAYLMDIMNISSLGIPIFAIIAKKRNVTLACIVNSLENGSIHFYEVKTALKEFVIL